MADQINDGGPAFPRDHAHDGHNGMTLRDHFAAKAMPVVHAEYMVLKEGHSMSLHDYEDIAADAYKLADAMLKARAA
jgi:hypothetical protein